MFCQFCPNQTWAKVIESPLTNTGGHRWVVCGLIISGVSGTTARQECVCHLQAELKGSTRI